MRLHLIRHAESANNVLYNGTESAQIHTPDPTITKKGHAQSRRLAQFLAKERAEPIQHPFQQSQDQGFGLTHLYSSLMKRSLTTAGYIAKALNMKQVALPDIYEKYGLYEIDAEGNKRGVQGPTELQLRTAFPDVEFPNDIGAAGWWNRAAETTAEFTERVTKSISEIRSRHAHTDDRVAMVAHGDYIDQFVNAVQGVDRKPENYAQPWVSNWTFHNTSISRIDLGNDSANVIYMNRIEHLPADLVSW